MKRDVIAGAQYSDLRTTGECVATIPGRHVITHAGTVPFPPGEPWGLLFLCQSTRGPWKFAGKGHETGETWEWLDGAWHGRGPSNGTNGFVYGADGELRIITPGPDVTSQGYKRNVDSIALGDVQYGPFHGLSEYTYIGLGIYIGQGDPQHGTPEGVVSYDENDNTHRLIEAGLCTFIRVDRLDHNVAITFTTPAGVVLIQTAFSELLALPVVDAAPGPPPVVVVPPPPVKEPEPMPIVANQIGTIIRLRAQYPTPLGARHGAFLVAAAKATGAKLLRKDSGTNVELSNGVHVSQDILMFGDQGVDILSDGEGAATPTWGDKGTIAGEYVDVSGFGAEASTPASPVTPVPGGLTIDLAPALAPVFAKIALLQADVAALKGALADANAAIAAAKGSTAAATALLDGTRIALKAWTGEHLTAEPDGTINAHGPRAFGEYQQFVVEVQQ